MFLKHQQNMLLLVLFSSAPLFFWGGPGNYSHRLFKEFWNFGHLIFFGLFAVWFCNYLFGKGRSIVYSSIVVITSVACIGLVIELAQLDISDRSFSWIDVLRDLSGGIIGICYVTGRDSTRQVLPGFLATIILLMNLVPFALICLDEYRAHRDFPLLASFENALELKRWGSGKGISRNSIVRHEGKWSAKITLTTEKYSGVSLQHFPRNWSTQKVLTFSVFNPGPDLPLHYRVHDKLHRGSKQQYSNRFNGSTMLTRGWNKIAIPMEDILNGPRDREMDLTQIHGFGVFVIQQTTPRVIYIDDVRLM